MTDKSPNQNQGCLYGVGVGPGDPDLLTIKAQRLLQRVEAICFTQLDDGRESYALSVVRDSLNIVRPELISITVPSDDSPVSEQTWRDAASRIGAHLEQGRDVAFITEGDPMLYSEFSHLLESVRSAFPNQPVEVLPGVSSIMAAAASSGTPLVTHGQRLAILPAVYGIDDLAEAITSYDSIVLMKVNRTLLQALANLETLGLGDKAVYVRRATTPEEQVVLDVKGLSGEHLDYFSLLIIKR